MIKDVYDIDIAIDKAFSILNTLSIELDENLESMPDCNYKDFLEDLKSAVEEARTKTLVSSVMVCNYLNGEQW